MKVSIPFIAGQWSLHEARRKAEEQARRVSIPFIAGQWSLLAEARTEIHRTVEFQSPSLRGSGRFTAASRSPRSARIRFQSPSLRGSGRFPPTSPRPAPTPSRFNPLHCGAVVASSSIAMIAPIADASFNPLHCGAVVASRGCASTANRRSRCFNPLHCGAVVASVSLVSVALTRLWVFQSPSLRGSGRFRKQPYCELAPCLAVSIPFIAGQWSLLAPSGAPRSSAPRCFNPLHCGAVVASSSASPAPTSPSSRFNPLHCGAVVASGPGSSGRREAEAFQSPSLRGSGRFRLSLAWGVKVSTNVSIPFIAGQWSLLPRTTPSSLFGVLLRKRRLPCDHIICTRLPF